MKKRLNKYTSLLSLRFKNKSVKKAFVNFSKKTGLVYFGFVNQHSDEHKIIRGLTVSSTHQDNHYSVGTINGYDLSIVNRTNYTVRTDGLGILNNWVIFAFELHTKTAIPHFFMGAKNRDLQPFDSLFTTFPNMKEVDLSVFDNYGSDFTSRYALYARPAKSAEIQKIISINTSKMISAHFWPLSVEQHNNVLYLYSTFERITVVLLDSMLKNGLWLAGLLDKQLEIVED